jgi:hypothetical protein
MDIDRKILTRQPIVEADSHFNQSRYHIVKQVKGGIVTAETYPDGTL